MNKHLLKTSLICWGVILLCGMFSFKTPEKTKPQQNYQTAAILFDTIMTQNEEEPQIIKKEVVAENDNGGYTCRLHVLHNNITGSWTLYLQKYCDQVVHVEYSYIIKYADNSQKQFNCKINLVRNGDTAARDKNRLAIPEEIDCIPVSVKAWACFDNE